MLITFQEVLNYLTKDEIELTDFKVHSTKYDLAYLENKAKEIYEMPALKMEYVPYEGGNSIELEGVDSWYKKGRAYTCQCNTSVLNEVSGKDTDERIAQLAVYNDTGIYDLYNKIEIPHVDHYLSGIDKKFVNNTDYFGLLTFFEDEYKHYLKRDFGKDNCRIWSVQDFDIVHSTIYDHFPYIHRNMAKTVNRKYRNGPNNTGEHDFRETVKPTLDKLKERISQDVSYYSHYDGMVFVFDAQAMEPLPIVAKYYVVGKEAKVSQRLRPWLYSPVSY